MRYVFRHITLILLGCYLTNASAQTTSHTHHAVKHHAQVVSHHTPKKTNSVKTKSTKVVTSKKIVSKKKPKKKLAKKTVPVVHHRVVIPNDRTALVSRSVPNAAVAHINEHHFPSFFSSIEDRLVNFVHKTVTTLRYSSYKLGGRNFDPSNGVYIVDCSDYVDHILEEIYPNAYSNLVDHTGADKPTTAHYYSFFRNLSSNSHWSKINDVEELRAGDILVFRNNSTGHVMVVMDKPTYEEDAYFVRVADSAPSGHSEDTRPKRVSGIGIGTLLLKANPRTGEPLAYAWKVGARWSNNMKIAMARPAAG